MILRFATAGDIPALNRLLRQVLQVQEQPAVVLAVAAS